MSTTKTPRSTVAVHIDQLSPTMQWIFHATSFLGSLIKPLLIITAALLLVVALTPEHVREMLVLNVLAFSTGYAILHSIRGLRRLMRRD